MAVDWSSSGVVSSPQGSSLAVVVGQFRGRGKRQKALGLRLMLGHCQSHTNSGLTNDFVGLGASFPRIRHCHAHRKPGLLPSGRDLCTAVKPGASLAGWLGF